MVIRLLFAFVVDVFMEKSYEETHTTSKYDPLSEVDHMWNL